MRRTRKYNLRYLEDGDFYSERSDNRRMSTIDVHLRQFAQTVGDGISEGWEINVVSGRIIEITPGWGLINGLLTETEWLKDGTTGEPKRKTQALADDNIITAEIPNWSDARADSWLGSFYTVGGQSADSAFVFKRLGPDGEDLDNDGIPDGVLHPSYQEPPIQFFENPYVKAIDRSSVQFLLTDNADNFITAERLSVDDASDTFCKFNISTINTTNNKAVLLAVVSVRNGEVSNIDYSATRRLKGLKGAISEIAKNYLVRHRHGGGRVFDPPAVRLETDTRNARLSGVFSNGKVEYTVFGNKETSATDGHRHTYVIDDNGNGYTQEVIGKTDFHYHTITAFVVDKSLKVYGSSLPTHSHEIGSEIDSWRDDVPVRVFVNGKVLPSGYTVDTANKKILFDKGVVSIHNAIFKTSFPIDEETVSADGETKNPVRIFELEMETRSVKQFIVAIISKFVELYSEEYNNFDEESKYKEPTIRDPFTFLSINGQDVEQGKTSYVIADYTPVNIWPEGPTQAFGVEIWKNTGNLPPGASSDSGGLKLTSSKEFDSSIRAMQPYLDQQAAMASLRLKKPGDTFMLLPYVARFIPITLVSTPHVDDVTIEILENVEVQGKLKDESLLFVKSEKFTTGVFDDWLIPVLNHSGRIMEPVIPERYRTYTEDGFSFYAVPTTTDISLGHSHIVSVDRLGTGATAATLVNNEISVSQSVNGLPIRISHGHTITSGVVSEAVNPSINSWQEETPETAHSHLLQVPVSGNPKSIFSIIEDLDGNLYMGTSDGLMMKPSTAGYKIVINGYEYYDANKSAYEAAKLAFYRHASITGEFVEFADDLQAKTTYLYPSATTSMACQTYAYGEHFSGKRKDTNGQILPISASVSVSPIDIIYVDGFYDLSVKNKKSLVPDDEILFTYVYKETTDESASVQNSVTEQPEQTEDLYLVKRSYNKCPVWSLACVNDGSIVACSSKATYRNQDGKWVETLVSSGISRQIIKDSESNVLVTTDADLNILNKTYAYSKQRKLQPIAGESDVISAIEATPGVLMASTEYGIYKSENNGQSWTESLANVTNASLSRDYWLDETTIEDDHKHYLIVNQNGDGITTNAFTSDDGIFNGTPHIHNVNGWKISESEGHLHAMSTSIFAKTQSGGIYVTRDSGDTWEEITEVTKEFGETGEFAAGFESLFVACEKGLARYSEAGWELYIPGCKARAFAWSNSLDKLFIGSDNIVYSISSDLVVSRVLQLNGSPIIDVEIDGVKKHFDYAYSNMSNGVFFKRQVGTKAEVQISTSYDTWRAKNGGWDPARDYKVFINDRSIIDTKLGIDRRKELDIIFDIDVSNGMFDFSSTTELTSDIVSGQITINISSTEEIDVNDTIVVIKFPEIDNTDTASKQNSSLGVIQEKRIVVSKTKSTITLDKPFLKKISPPAKVKLIPSLEGDANISVSVYQSGLNNIGKFTHDEIEDSLSWESVGSPYHMASTHISNLSELTTAIKYALPEVDDKYKNWKSYMMRFGRDESEVDPMSKAFDVSESNIRSGVSASTVFNPVKSLSVNVVAPGVKTYSNVIFVGTDAGLFVAKKEPDLSANWFVVYDCPAGSIYDISFPGGDRVVVAGQNGIFTTTGGTLRSWERVATNLATGPSYFVRNRWKNFGLPNGIWWSSWGESLNLVDSDLTNTIVAGGQDYVMLSNDNGASWIGATTPMATSDSQYTYKCSNFTPLKNGTALLVANGIRNKSARTGQENRILYTAGLGENWKNLYRFIEYTGKIVSVGSSSGGNTELEIKYNNSFGVQANFLSGLPITINNKTFKIVSNRNERIVLYGLAAATSIFNEDSFKIDAPIINAISEDSNGRLYISAGTKLFTDAGTLKPENRRLGTIVEINKSATVNAIDSSGTINSLRVSSNLIGNEKTTSLVCTLNRQASLNEFVGKTLIPTGYIIPSVSFITPQPSESVASSEVPVSLSIQSFDLGTSGSVRLKLDAREEIITTSSVYVLEGVTKGDHTLTAQLLDADGNELTNEESVSSVIFSTEYTTTSPVVEIMSPAEGATVTSGTFKAVFKVSNFNTGTDGNLLYSLDSAGEIPVAPFGSGIAELTIQGVSDGQHAIKARLIDNLFQTIGEQSQVSFVVASGGNPNIFITYPPNGLTLPGGGVTFTYATSNVSIPATESVRITLDKQTFISNDPTNFTVSNLSNGDHVVTVELLDQNLVPFPVASAKSSVSFKVDATLGQSPTAYILYPVNGTQIGEADYVDISYSVSGFEIPVNGGVIIKVNDGAEVFRDSLEPYKIPGSPGDYIVTVTLASSPTVKLSNSSSVARTTFEILPSLLTRSYNNDSSRNVQTNPESFSSVNQENTKSDLRQNKKTMTTMADNRWSILSNSASALNGSTKIVINGSLPASMKGQAFRIAGDSSTIYLSFDQKVTDGEFNNGIAYVDTGEPNEYKSYSISKQTQNRIELKELIDPSKEIKKGEIKHVEVGQKIKMIPSSGRSTIWVNFSNDWSYDELCGALVRVQGASQTTDNSISGTASFVVVDSDTTSITINSSSPYLLRKGESLDLDSIAIQPLMSFCGNKTDKNLDHAHNVSLIGKFLKGSVLSTEIFGATQVKVTPVLSSSIENQLLLDNPFLLDNADVLFFDPNDPRRQYKKRIVSVENGALNVKKGDVSDWGFNSLTSGISQGWEWVIDARWYGATDQPKYDNFITLQSRLTEDATAGTYEIKPETTTGFAPGDSIEIWDSEGSQTARISSVSLVSVQLDVPLLKPYKVSDGANIRTRADSFSNQHTHVIKDGEVYETSVEEYTTNGYMYSHSHELTGLLNTTKAIVFEYDSGRLIVAGAGSSIFASDDNGQTWLSIVDTNDIFGDWNGSFISLNQSIYGDLLAGTNDGRFIGQGVPEQDTQMVFAGNEEIMPSSSSQSSVSSISTESSLSSVSTFESHSSISSSSSVSSVSSNNNSSS
jgi:photosystem II stability/assembly factor-like uncharacterized protein